jgi:hypothetical protein
MNRPPIDRDDVGPFIVLGVDKDVDAATLHARVAERLRQIDRGECRFTRADVEWARDVLRDRKSRLRADVDHLNPDLASGALGRLARLYHLDGAPPGWEPLDPEPVADLPGLDAIDVQALAAGLVPPEAPLHFPTLDHWAARRLEIGDDPWAENLFG